MTQRTTEEQIRKGFFATVIFKERFNAQIYLILIAKFFPLFLTFLLFLFSIWIAVFI